MRYAILAFTVVWSCCASAQLNGKYTFRHLDQTNGLLHTTVRGIGQDEKGFIWILSYNGLQRYDGSRFVSYPEIINQSSFTVFHDSELFVDTAKQQIWVTKGNTMEKLDLSSQTMTTHHLSDVSNEDVFQKAILYRGENQDKFQISESGMIVYEKNTSKIIGSNFNVNPGQYHRNTLVITDPETGDLWTHNFNSFIITDRKTQTFQSSGDTLPTHPLLRALWKQNTKTNKIRYIMMDSYHNVWISTWTNMLHRYNLETKEFFTYSLKAINSRQHENQKGDNNLLINAMYEDRQKNLWLATDYLGLLLYDREKDDFNFITSDDKISNGLRYNFSIYTIFQDRDDNIWLGTDSGINIFNPYRNHFQSIRHEDGNEASLPKNDINDIIETAQGELWIATWGGGISVYDRKWHFLRNIYFNGPEKYNQIWSFVRHEDGTIWAGAQNGIIHIYDPIGQSFKTIQPKEIGYSTITKMTMDHEGNILIGLYNEKIAIWNKAENKFYAFADAHSDIPTEAVVDIYVDRLARCWVTSGSGLRLFDSQKRLYADLYQPGHIDPSKGIAFQGMLEYNDSTLLLGTIYEGIYFFNTNTKTFSRPPVFDHLRHTSVYAVRKDDAGNVWLTTNYSIIKLNTDLSQHTRFTLDHSVLKASLGSSRFYELNDGRWVTTSPAELICFDPLDISKANTKNHVVEISGFKVFDSPMYIDSFLSNGRPVILQYDKNFISVEFTALEFTDLREINYYYRLSDIDKNWIHSATNQFANYTDLKPGKYLFEVKADQGNGTSGITSFPIIITPPWWGTLWFRFMCLVALGSFLYLLLKKRIQLIRKEAEWKQKMAETEMMGLRSQMNPHFIFNCLNSIDNLIQMDQKVHATNYLAKFAQLIRAILENSKSNSIPCWKDLEALNLYLDMEALRWDHKINYHLDVDTQILQGDYKVPPMIIQPFVENAIHHGLLNKTGADNKLDIQVKLEGEQIKYTITDNGVGRLKAAEYKNLNRSSQLSFGIQITKDRLNLFNQDKNQSIKITDLYNEQGATGTKVEVWLTTQPIHV